MPEADNKAPKAYKQQLERLEAAGLTPVLSGIIRGIEKESLRVDASGHLAQTQHPAALGSPLTHPYITTDYSEALLEFITPTFTDPAECLGFLDKLHRFTCQHINDEILWTASMPCILENDEDIPVAQYGSSNIATMKTVYRIGLGHRYGRRMQTIAGIHYNFSMPADFWPAWQQQLGDKNELQTFITNSYFAMIRNFRRYNWLLLLLFGASPAACKSFLRDKAHQLDMLDDYTLYLPDATSLRMGDLGYTSKAQDNFVVNYNSLQAYTETLGRALFVPHDEYQKIGIKGDEGWRQLNTSLLQIENEFYSTVRPKRTAHSGESPLNALARAGVEYIELRCLDINPFTPLGIDLEQIHFIDAFMLYCLMECSREETSEDFQNIRNNIKLVVNQGRDTSTLLQKSSEKISIKDWGLDLLQRVSDCARLLDQANNTDAYSKACQAQRDKILDTSLTPAGKIIDALNEQNKPFAPYATAWAKHHTGDFRQRPLSTEEQHELAGIAADSLQKQQNIEQADNTDFETFLADYFDRARKCCQQGS